MRSGNDRKECFRGVVLFVENINVKRSEARAHSHQEQWVQAINREAKGERPQGPRQLGKGPWTPARLAWWTHGPAEETAGRETRERGRA